jgi:periplasmic copper chaperone A
MSRLIKASRLAALTLAALLPSLGHAADTRAGALEIRQPWARATPNGAEIGGGYVTIINHGTAPDALVGGSFQASKGFELHEMTVENGVMRMRPTGPVPLPPGGTLVLAPSGKHIMFTGLTRGLKKGEHVAGTLAFRHAGSVPVTFEVEGIGAKGPSAMGGQAGPAMDGMTMDPGHQP